MFEPEVFVGEWDELSRVHASLLRGHRVEILVLNGAKGHKPISEGMFPGLSAVNESDFRAAEWQGPTAGEI